MTEEQLKRGHDLRKQIKDLTDVITLAKQRLNFVRSGERSAIQIGVVGYSDISLATICPIDCEALINMSIANGEALIKELESRFAEL